MFHGVISALGKFSRCKIPKTPNLPHTKISILTVFYWNIVDCDVKLIYCILVKGFIHFSCHSAPSTSVWCAAGGTFLPPSDSARFGEQLRIQMYRMLLWMRPRISRTGTVTGTAQSKTSWQLTWTKPLAMSLRGTSGYSWTMPRKCINSMQGSHLFR